MALLIPEPSDGFAASGPVRRARKSELQLGTFRGVPAVAKRITSTSAVWQWYFAREVAIYRAFGDAPPVHAPRLLAVDATTMVLDLLPGAPLATRRTPHAELSRTTIDLLLGMRDRIAAWHGPVPDLPAPPAVRSQLRARLLEDPTNVAWIANGLARVGLVATLDDRTAFSHGDLLLRNVVGDGLVDWECAGIHHADWDVALLWSQLGPEARAYLETAVRPTRSFWAIAAFALAREIRFLESFRTRDAHPELVRQRADLAEVVARLH